MKSLFCILFFVFAFVQIHAINIQCLTYSNNQCTKCPYDSHLYQNECYQNITACLTYQYYSGAALCLKCNQTISTLVSSKCILNSNFANSSFISNAVVINQVVTTNPSIKTSTTSSASSVTISGNTYYYNVDQYGQGTFSYVCLCQAVKDELFNLCNKHMLTGQYSHFISKTSQPVISVSTYLNGQIRQFKILYEGSGGILLLSIISININTKAIILLSFVSIGTTQIVDNCIDYSIQINCMRCAQGFHLQQRNGQQICYQNIDGCSSYYKGICLKCSGFLLLVQNRCVSQCNSISDCRSIAFYHNQINFDLSSTPNLLIVSRYQF